MGSTGCGVVILIMAITSCEFTFAFIYSSNTNKQECQTPDSKYGECVPLIECGLLQTLITFYSHKPEAVSYVQQSKCGSRGFLPLVCCGTSLPRSATTVQINLETIPEVTTTRNNMINHPNFKLLPVDCGVVYKRRITNGDETEVGQYPWMAILRYTDIKTGWKRDFCAGTLINRRYVLTVAHCIAGIRSNFKLTEVILGEHNTKTDLDCEETEFHEKVCAPPPVTVGVEKVILHPSYQHKYTWDRRNDIALIRLDKDIPIEVSRYIKPICFPRDDKDYFNMTSFAAGWGKTGFLDPESKILLHTNLTILDIKKCVNAYRRQSIIDYSQICAGGEDDMRDTCKGDSGGPLMIPGSTEESPELRGRFFVIGLVSYGPQNCGMTGSPTIYTKVSAFIGWILDHLEE